MSDHHHETHLEAYVVERLRGAGWQVGTSAGYDADHALYPEDLETWARATQPKAWERLEALNGARAREVFVQRLERALETSGTVDVLRRGFQIAGAGQIDMSEAAPEDARNQAVLDRYRANILRVVPQLKYHPGRDLAIDLGLFINGIPVATVELKTDFTQSVEEAKAQYANDRLPEDPKTRRRHPLLTQGRGAVVHFAMSDSEIWMTTRLAGASTLFLPFNQGQDGRGGNPPRADGEYPVAYFWERICQPDAWLRIFHSFVYTETRDVVDLAGNWTKKKTLIFPRYHQFDAVEAAVADARANGPGQAYLFEHSAGSGKTSTIAWTAHDLTRLRTPDGQPVFHKVIIVTDRNVLDGQLQDAVRQIDHQKGLIAAIDGDARTSESKSSRLAKAMLDATPIIVVTIQTFPYAMEAILTEGSLSDKGIAVIIDEAHTSQTGSTASKLQATLAMPKGSDTAEMSVEEILATIQKSRARPANVSHFAFTATPKHSTMMLFGRPEDPSRPAADDNLPRAFHKYEMRQAIDEGFILDVLRGYVSYSTAFRLGTEAVETRRVEGRSAKRALASWMALHPTNVTQKVAFIMQHFSANVAHLLGGRAKAMVVTSSRAAAVRYKRAFDAYIAAHPECAGVRTLVAFSGKVSGKEVAHEFDDRSGEDAFRIDEADEFTEAKMNPGIAGQDLRHVFDRPEYRVMIVANKFQTGFDQPKLVAMYLDKKIANEVEIVQTLSRLNRTHPGKDQTFVIDFVNDPAAIRAAFARYDAGAQIEEVQDLNVIYDMKAQLDREGIYADEHVETFRRARFGAPAAGTSPADPVHRAMFAATEEPTATFNRRLRGLRIQAQRSEDAYQVAKSSGDDDGMKAADHDRKAAEGLIAALANFRSGLDRLNRTYGYIAQLIDLGDPEFENFAAFAKLLSSRLDGTPAEAIDLHGIALMGYDIKRNADAGSGPGPAEGEDESDPDIVLHPVGPGGGDTTGKVPLYIREIIEKLNGIFGDVAPLKDQAALVNHIVAIARENQTVAAQVARNPKHQALKGNLPGAVQGAVVRAMQSTPKLAAHLLREDRQALEMLTSVIYDLMKNGGSIDLDGV